jgi:hypothetical protein
MEIKFSIPDDHAESLAEAYVMFNPRPNNWNGTNIQWMQLHEESVFRHKLDACVRGAAANAVPNINTVLGKV